MKRAAAVAVLLAWSLPAQEEIPADPIAAVAGMAVAAHVDAGRIVQALAGGEPAGPTDLLLLPTDWQRDAADRALWKKIGEQQPDATMAQLTAAVLRGTRYRTDDSGRAVLPHDRAGMLVAVRGRMVKSAFLAPMREPSDRAVRVRLRPRWAVDVVVTDHRGRPAVDAPIALVDPAERYQQMLVLARTNAAGRATLPIPARARDRAGQLAVRPWFPLRAPQETPIDGGALREGRAGPIALQLPEYGQVRVYAQGQDGKLTSGVLGAALQAVVPGEDDWRRFRRPQFQAAETTADSATFSHVALGLQLRVELGVAGEQQPRVLLGDGPVRPMEMVVLTGDTSTGPPTLAFRLLDQQGAPVRRETVGIVTASPGYYDGTTRGTNEDGRLTVQLSERCYAAAPNAKVFVVRRAADGTARGSVAVAVDAGIRRGRNDLGDRQLRAEPLLVGGRVVDGRGRPIAGVRVTCDPHWALPQAAAAAGSGHSWSADERFRAPVAVSDADGRFALRELGGTVPGEVELKIDGDELVPLAQPRFPPGRDDIVLQVTRAATLAGRFADAPSRLEGMLRLQRHGDATPVERYVVTDPDGSFAVPGLRPGVYDVALQLNVMQQDAEPDWRAPGIELAPGARGPHPSLAAIDWRAFASFVEVRVLDPRGQPLQNGFAQRHFVRERSRASSGISSREPGVWRLLVPKSGAKLSFHHPLYLSMKLEDPEGEVTLTGVPRPRVRVRVPDLPAIPDNLQLRQFLRLAEPTWGDVGTEVRFVAADTLEFRPSRLTEFVLDLTPALVGSEQGKAAFGVLRKRLDCGEADPAEREIVWQLDEVERDVLANAIAAAKEKTEDRR